MALFAAPTFNLMVSQYRQSDGGIIGIRIVPSWVIYDRVHFTLSRSGDLVYKFAQHYSASTFEGTT